MIFILWLTEVLHVASNRTRSDLTCCLYIFSKLAGKNQRPLSMTQISNSSQELSQNPLNYLSDNKTELTCLRKPLNDAATEIDPIRVSWCFLSSCAVFFLVVLRKENENHRKLASFHNRFLFAALQQIFYLLFPSAESFRQQNTCPLCT